MVSCPCDWEHTHTGWVWATLDRDCTFASVSSIPFCTVDKPLVVLVMFFVLFKLQWAHRFSTRAKLHQGVVVTPGGSGHTRG